MKKIMIAVGLVLAMPGAAAGTNQAAPEIGREAAIAAYEEGRAAMQRRDWARAIAQFERAARHQEILPAARFHLGLVRERLGDQQSALAIYKAVLDMRNVPGQIRSGAYDRLTQIGFERLQKKDAAGAELALEPAAKTSRFDTLYYYGMALGMQQKWAALEQAAQALLRVSPYDAAGWSFLHEAQRQQAQASAANPARAAEAAKLREKLAATTNKINALPFILEDISMAQEAGTHVVTATMIGNAASASSWCIIDFSLAMDKGNWRASAMTNPPAKGQKVALKVRPATSSQSPAPPASERVYNVSYPAPYCEEKGAAAVTPPEAQKASLDGCPETEGDARRLLAGRREVGRWSKGSGNTDYSYPAGGIRLFDTSINRLTVRGDLYQFGLPGTFADHERQFARRYREDCANDGIADYCQSSTERKSGHLAFATLIKTNSPERMHPQQTYLRCLY